MKKLIAGLMIFLMITSCSSNISAKKLKTRAFQKRTYRFCSPVEVEEPWGKLCYRVCSRSIISRCVKTKLIIEDLKDPETHKKFLFGSFIAKRRAGGPASR
jgi:hypothetical protein